MGRSVALSRDSLLRDHLPDFPTGLPWGTTDPEEGL